MDSFNILVPPDEDFPEVVVAKRMGEGFEREYVEYEPRWRFDRRRRAVVADEKFFYAMADTAERLKAENAKLRELVLDLYCLAYPSTVEWEVSDETYDKYSPCEKCQELHGGKSPCASTAKDMTEECCAPIQANVVADCLRELGVEVDG